MHVIRNNRLEEVGDDDPDVDFVLESPAKHWSTHINMIPLQSAVQSPRLFYGARFVNQALSLENGEAPLVQNLDPNDKEGRSFDQILGNQMGIQRAKRPGTVMKVTPDSIRVRHDDDGTEEEHELYNDQPFNQKSVVGATEIVIRRRSGELWRGPIADYAWRKTDCVAAYDPVTLKSAWQRVIRKVEHVNDKQLLRVSYTSGRHVVVTEDHSLLHFDGERIAPILPGQCAIGRTKSPIVFGGVRGRAGKPGDYDLGLLVGLYLSEGDLPLEGQRVKVAARRLSNNVRIAVTGTARRKQVDDLFVRLGHSPNKRSEGRAAFNCRRRSAWVAEHCGRGAGNKFIHPSLLAGSADLRLGILRGFMAGDGCMESDSNGALHVHSAVTSERLRDDLVLLLNGMGIFTTLFFAGRKRYSDLWNDAFGFRVISRHLSKLDRWFFYDDRHEDYKGWLRETYRASPFERITVPVAYSNKASLAPLGVDNLGPGQVTNYVRKTSGLGGILVAKHNAARAAGPYGLLGASDLLWDTVEAVELAPFEEMVYDLSVENAEAFAVCGGLLVHNSGVHSRTLVKPGDKFTKGQMLAATNYTDDEGTVNMGLNARVGLVPWNGHTMDDAIALSESFANRFKATQYKVMKQDSSDNLKADLNHFRSMFPTRFSKETLENFDPNGLVKPGTVLKSGDPILLATMPRTLSSAGANVGKLSKVLQQSRRDASMVWEGHGDATVVDSRMTKNGYKVVLKYSKSLAEGDKITFRQGGKGTVAKVIPDDRMPRTLDGHALEVMLNPLSLVSRANPATAHELRLGKVARALGKPIKVPSYLPKGQSWDAFIRQQEEAAGVQAMERIFDPETNRELVNPIAVGYGFINRLHHTSASKSSARGVAGYDCFDDQTEVLTDRGWVTWPDVTESDALATMNEEKTSMTFEHPAALQRYDYDGEMLGFEGRYLDWLVTPNHKFLVQHMKSKTWQLKTAEELYERTYYVPQFGYVYEGAATEEFSVDFSHVGRAGVKTSRINLPWDDYAALTGWWLSEGSVQVGEHYTVRIFQDIEANPVKFAEIEALLRRLGLNFCYVKGRGHVIGFKISHKALALHYNEHCFGVCQKRLPRELFTASLTARELLLAAFIDGDGHRAPWRIDPTKHSARISSVCRELLDDLQVIALSVGLGGVLSAIKPSPFKQAKNPDKHQPQFYLGIANHRRKATVDFWNKGNMFKQYYRAHYKGEIFCATMPTSGMLLVRRNGKPCWTGNSNDQPLRGGHSEGAQAKRFSGLENAAAMSSGAYALMRENATLRGSRNDEYWRALRAGKSTPVPGVPFVMHKFRALLSGAGINTRDVGKGRVRLAPFTDRDLDGHDPVDVENGNIVDTKTLSPIKGGLFDPRIVTGEKWGRIRLPRSVPNPAYSEAIRVMLGITQKEMDAVLRGEAELPPKLRERLGLDKPQESA